MTISLITNLSRSRVAVTALIMTVVVVLIDAPTGYRLPHDISSYIYAAQAQNDSGTNYSAAFINRPPLLLLLLDVWETLTPSLIGRWHLLHGLCLFLVIYPLMKIGGLFYRSTTSIVLCGVLLTSLYFSGYVDMFLATEIIGLSFFVSGLWLLLRVPLSSVGLLAGLAVCGSSALIREQFVLPVLLVTTWIVLRQQGTSGWLFALVKAALALSIPLFVGFTYLTLSNSFDEYVQILQWSTSRESSSPTNWYWNALRAVAVALPLLRHSNQNLVAEFLDERRAESELHILTIVIALILYQLRKLWYLSATSRGISLACSTNTSRHASGTWQRVLVLVAGLGLLIGVAHQSQGYRFNGHYAIASLIAIYLILLASLPGSTPQQSRAKQVASLLAIALAIFPTTGALSQLTESVTGLRIRSSLTQLVQPMASVATPAEKHIRTNSSNDNSECALNLYGWGLGAFYIYSGIPSCSRHFLSPLIGEGNEARQFRFELLANPPMWIHLGCQSDGCADHSIDEFETLSFPTRTVVATCYTPVKSIHQTQSQVLDLFQPLTKSRAELTSCIASVLQAAGLNLRE